MIRLEQDSGIRYVARTPTKDDIPVLKQRQTWNRAWSTPAAGTEHIVEIMPKSGRDKLIHQITAVAYTGATVGWYTISDRSALAPDSEISFMGNRTGLTNWNQPVLIKDPSEPVILRSNEYLNFTIVHGAGVATTGRVWVTYSEV